MVPSEFELLVLVDLIYEAVQDPALWPQFLERCAAAFGCSVVNLCFTPFRQQLQLTGDDAEKEAFARLVPHVARARAIQARLRLLDTSTAALDALDIGVVIVNDRAELIHCNAAADEVLRRGDAFSCQDGVLRAESIYADAQLQQTIRQGASPDESADCPPPISIPRTASPHPYSVLSARFRNRMPAFGDIESPYAVLLIVDPEERHAASVELLIALYGLTQREAMLASRLSTGRTMEKAADDLGMTYQTARSHLRRIFDKTTTSRQAELVMLLARLPKRPTRRR